VARTPRTRAINGSTPARSCHCLPDDTILEDPAAALAEARGQAAGATAEAESHATASERRARPYGRPAAELLEDQASALHESELDEEQGPPGQGK